MAKLVLSALLRSRRNGIDAKVAEFPDIKVSALSVGAAIARLRTAIWQRMRWTKVETNCSGELVSPVPQIPSGGDLAVPIEVEVAVNKP